MQFRDLAVAEIDALRRAAVGRAAQAQRDLQCLRDALDQAAAALDTTLAASPPEESAIATIIDKLAAAAAADVEIVAAELRAEAQRALEDAANAANIESDRAVQQAVAAARAESQRALAEAVQAARVESARALEQAVHAARADAKRALDEAAQAARIESEQAVARAVNTARAEAQRATAEAVKAVRAELTAQIEEERRRTTSIAEQLKAATSALSVAETRWSDAEAARDQEAADRAQAEHALADLRHAAASAAQELVTARGQLTSVQGELAAAQAAIATAQAEADAARKDADRRVRDHQRALIKAEAARAEQVRTLRGQTVKAALEPIEHLRTAFHRLSGAKRIDDVLTILLEALGTEFSRVAMFEVTANCIEGRRHIGFEAEGGIAKILVPLNVQSPLTNAVRTGRVQGLPARDLSDPAHVLFGGSPTFVLALPVPVRGRVIAVIYADDCDQPDAEFITPERRVKFAEVLLWHAIPLLTRFALEEEATAELREEAASVVRDLEAAYAADAGTVKGAELRARLAHHLEQARRRFLEHTEADGPAAAALLDQTIAKAVAALRTTPFGRDLAGVAGIVLNTEKENSDRPATSQRA